MSPVLLSGTIAGPFLAGYIYDVTGSYSTALTLFAAANLTGLVLILLARKPKLGVAVEQHSPSVGS